VRQIRSRWSPDSQIAGRFARGLRTALCSKSRIEMEAKDYVLLIGVGVTLLLGVWNLIQGYRTTRKTSFINTVTSLRILWIEQLRQDVAKFSGLTHTCVCRSSKASRKNQNP
jgi:hypothetical protein